MFSEILLCLLTAKFIKAVGGSENVFETEYCRTLELLVEKTCIIDAIDDYSGTNIETTLVAFVADPQLNRDESAHVKFEGPLISKGPT